MHRLNYKYLVSLIHSIPPKYIRLTGIIAACLFVVLLIGGIIAYNKREAILQHEIVKAKARPKVFIIWILISGRYILQV